MPLDDSRYPSDWTRIAEKDILRAERSLRDDDPELAGFCLQQALEKFLKAFLLAKGWQLRRIHDLEALLDDAVVHDTSLEEFRTLCQKATKYYFLERYPLTAGFQLPCEEVQACLQSARLLIARLWEAMR